MVTSISRFLGENQLSEIFSHLHCEDLDHVKLVNKLFYETIKNNHNFIWAEIAKSIDCPIATQQKLIGIREKVIAFVSEMRNDLINIQKDVEFPEYIKEILNNHRLPTFEEIRCLQQFRLLLNIFVIWQALSDEIGEPDTLEEGLSIYKTPKELFAKAGTFTSWCERHEENLLKLEEFYFSNKKFTFLPKEIKFLKGLLTLELPQNHLTKLPKEIGELKQLERMDLDDNDLTEVGEEIGELTNLKILSLANNALKFLPKKIDQCIQLEVLNLSNNAFTSLPNEVMQCTKLQRLFLLENQLTILPQEIGNLIKLKELNLNDNKLTELPDEGIGKLALLEELYLNNNKLTRLSIQMKNLTSLITLEMGENEIISANKEIFMSLYNLRKLVISPFFLVLIQKEIRDHLLKIEELMISEDENFCIEMTKLKRKNREDISIQKRIDKRQKTE